MKKELKKQLEKLIPEGFNIENYEVNSFNPFETEIGKYFELRLYVNEKRPEWVKVISDTTVWPQYQLLKVIGSENTGYIVDYDGAHVVIWFKKCIPATPAEIEAHKLGFHIGDDVWVKEFEEDGSSKIISFGYLGGKLIANKSNNNFDYIQNLTKIPPELKLFLGDKEVKLTESGIEINGKHHNKYYFQVFLSEAIELFDDPKLKQQIEAITDYIKKNNESNSSL